MKNCLSSGPGRFRPGLSMVVLLRLIASPAMGQTLPTELNLVVVEGEGAINNVRERVAREPMVRVEDENHKPVVGAMVMFTLPTEGATGEFTGGAKTLTMPTDPLGQATGKGLKINQVPGKLQIHVSVSYKGLSARTVIAEFVEGPAIHGTKGVSHASTGKWVAIVAVVGAAAAGGAVYATKSKTTPTALTPTPLGPAIIPIGLTAGTGTIAPPH